VNFFYTHISERAIDLAVETLRTTFVSEGKRVEEFEQKLASNLGLINPVALNSATSALHLALVLAEVGPGDEVILPAQTFVATGLVILMCGAKPVFADIQRETGNIDPVSIAEKITGRTKAIIPVHWGGYPCDLDEINSLAERNGLAVIEDAAHALGATYRGRAIGSISRLTAFSFQAIKHLTTGDGGALCCLDETDHKRARAKRWFGIDRANSKASELGEREYNLSEVGYKYHLNDLGAALGLGNLADLQTRLARRKDIAGVYRSEFGKSSGLTLLEHDDDRSSAHWIFTMLVERRGEFIRRLKSKGVPASVVHLRIDHNSVFGGLTRGLSNQESFNEQQVSVPVHEGLTDDNVRTIVEAVHSGW
jgi:perosamine synthetase